jgi:hypothetical protein
MLLTRLRKVAAGKLYQKRYCPTLDWRTGSVAQFVPTALAGTSAIHWRSEPAQLADPPQQLCQRGQPVLPGAALHRGVCLGLIWRNVFRAGAAGYGGDGGGGLFG